MNRCGRGSFQVFNSSLQPSLQPRSSIKNQARSAPLATQNIVSSKIPKQISLGIKWDYEHFQQQINAILNERTAATPVQQIQINCSTTSSTHSVKRFPVIPPLQSKEPKFGTLDTEKAFRRDTSQNVIWRQRAKTWNEQSINVQ